jgi:adenine-specific DNA-methyltransferase
VLLAKELLHESGSIFVQISDENLHHVREVMDEVYGVDNFCGIVSFRKTTGQSGTLLSDTNDYLLWYARDRERVKFRPLYQPREGTGWVNYDFVKTPDGDHRRMTTEEKENPDVLPKGSRIYRRSPLTSTSKSESTSGPVRFGKKDFLPGAGGWKTNADGFARLAAADRLESYGNTLSYRRYVDDFGFFPLSNSWNDTASGGYGADKIYVVQTNNKVIQRCVLMTTDPGDLVFDPTCGSGTTAYVAEQWGRRWITCDTSRVPLALARQRLLTATFPYYELKDHQAGPAGGFLYKRKQNRKGDDVGGLVPHVTLKSIAKDEPPAMEVLVDRPEVNDTVTRVSGPFVVEATIPPAQDLSDSASAGDDEMVRAVATSNPATHIDRMVEVLRQSQTLRLPGNRSISLGNIRRVADSDEVHAEAEADGERVAVVFGPEDGAISSDVVFNAGSAARFLKYKHVYFFGFAIQAKAREMVDDRKRIPIPCTYVAVTPDVVMSDLLKTNRASEIFSVTGLPDVKVRKTKKKNDAGAPLYEVELLGLDTFDPTTMENESIEAELLPAWLLDTDYDGMSFTAGQVFFPKTKAWDNLQKSLKATFDPSVWEHLAGTVSEPFALGKRKRIAVKVVDERGNELTRVVDVTE